MKPWLAPFACSAALLACVVALPSAALAQDWRGQGRLEGVVLDPDGKPVAGAVVKLDLPGRGGTEIKTDKKGHWAILGLASGYWNLDVQVKGFVEKQLSGISVSQEERTPPVQVRLEKAVPQGPPPAVRQALEKGDEAYKAGRWAEARAEYEKLFALPPEEYAKLKALDPHLDSSLHMQIARCYSQEKNYEKELEHLQKILDEDPTNAAVRKLMALEALQGGLFDKGLELLKTLDPATIQDPDILYNIAVAYYNNQKVDEAIDYLTKAVALNPAYADGYFLRANAYLGQSKMDLAKADYRKFLEVAAADDPRAETVKKVLEQLK